MFCPGCALQVSDDLKFCRQCGANLHGAREGMMSRSSEEKSDWGASWAANIRLAQEIQERQRGTLEERRLNEIKGTFFFNLSIDNLTDKRYFETRNFFESRVSPGVEALARIHATPGYPVGVSAGLTFRLGAKD